MSVHVGIGGWTYEPWRGLFYPKGLPQTRELAYVGEHLTGTEINATFYRGQSPASFAKWRDAVPQGFRFALKGSRYCTNRKDLSEAGESVARFMAQGLTELGDKLGPINWQLAATKKFDAAEIAAFLALLPGNHDGLDVRHAIEPRHESFDNLHSSTCAARPQWPWCWPTRPSMQCWTRPTARPSSMRACRMPVPS
ncbi:uncharacterized protein YecE (DUF72 family) [Novosphingobium gossypii]